MESSRASNRLDTRWREKDFVAGGFYHLTTHAVGEEDCFKDERDYATFMRLVNARLAPEPARDEHGRFVRSYHGEVELYSFCLMRNHPHLFLRQLTETAMTSFATSLLTSYAMRFNNRHGRSGQLFRRPYKARRVSELRLPNVIEYIHLNPFRKGLDPFAYRWSSHRYYAGLANTDWCLSDLGLRNFGGRAAYLRRMHDATSEQWSEPFD